MDPIDKADGEDANDPVPPSETMKPVDNNLTTQQNVAITTPEANRAAAMAASDEAEMLTLSQLLERLDLIPTLEPGTTKQRIKRMDARFNELNPVDRYELALLLSHKGANTRSLNRAISILDQLQESVNDNVVLKILQLQRSQLVLKKQYRLERSKTLKLEKKIERLKGLEQYLDKSNSRMQESLQPPPGDTQQQ